MRAAIYARLSAKGDDANIPQQLENGRKAVERRGWTLVDEYVDDGVSAWKEGVRRPDFQRLLADAQEGKVDVIVVREVDRLTRNAGDWGDLSRTGVQVATHGGEVLDNFIIGVFASLAAKESDVRSQRQLLHEDRRIAEGAPPRGGHRHFGYHRGCCPDCAPHTVRDDEAEVIHEAAQRWLSGEPMRSIARDLNGRGVTTTRGGEWNHQNLKKMLQSPRLAGIRVHRRNGEVHEHRGTWEPIVSQSLHARLVAADATSSTRRAPERYPLTGLLTCGRCSDPKAGKWVTLNGRRHREGQRRYNCLRCRRNGIDATRVEDALWNDALGRTWRRDQQSEAHVEDQLAQVEADLRTAAEKLDELDDDYWSARPTVDKRTYTRRATRLREDIAALEADAERLRGERKRAGDFWQSLVALDDEHKGAPPERRRAALEGAIRRVTLAPNAGRAGGKVNLGRISIEWMDGEVTGLSETPDVMVPAPEDEQLRHQADHARTSRSASRAAARRKRTSRR